MLIDEYREGVRFYGLGSLDGNWKKFNLGFFRKKKKEFFERVLDFGVE